MRRYRQVLGALALLLAWACSAPAQSQAETRVLNYIKQNLHPGEPLEVTELYSHFTEPAERQALGKLYNAFFRIPLFVAQYQQRFGKPPSLKVISQQFDLHTPEAADVLLSVMESDPRVPPFIVRNPHTHEITRVNVQMILNDPRFGGDLGRQLSGWEGRKAPPFDLARLNGGELSSSGLQGKTFLLYVWFTGCPPCMKETPQLVALTHIFPSREFSVVGANADRLLNLGYSDGVRRRYAREMKIDFPLVDWSKETNTAYGDIAIFPTLFLINARGVIVGHWVGYVPFTELRQAISRVVSE
ncbi:MAG TPA: TlpA disulfide reductase family protein [Terriglobia bacterium]|nr:TlpA disulfide reductase family protein [Terriglobia bacterium]